MLGFCQAIQLSLVLHSFYSYKYGGKTYTHSISSLSILACPCLKMNMSNIFVPRHILKSELTSLPPAAILRSLNLRKKITVSPTWGGNTLCDQLLLKFCLFGLLLKKCILFYPFLCMIRKHKAKLNLDLSNFPYPPKITKEFSKAELFFPRSQYHSMFFPFIL